MFHSKARRSLATVAAGVALSLAMAACDSGSSATNSDGGGSVRGGRQGGRGSRDRTVRGPPEWISRDRAAQAAPRERDDRLGRQQHPIAGLLWSLTHRTSGGSPRGEDGPLQRGHQRQHDLIGIRQRRCGQAGRGDRRRDESRAVAQPAESVPGGRYPGRDDRGDRDRGVRDQVPAGR